LRRPVMVALLLDTRVVVRLAWVRVRGVSA